MKEKLKLPAGVALLTTISVEAKQTVLTEILNGKLLKRLAITEPRANLKKRMHRHLRRDDYIYLLSGSMTLTAYDGKTYAKIPLKPRGEVIQVSRGVWHGYETGNDTPIILESSTEAFDPTDVEEFQGQEPT